MMVEKIDSKRLQQLENFVAWEKWRTPGKIHIAEWALATIKAALDTSSQPTQAEAPSKREALTAVFLQAMEWGRDYWSSFSTRGQDQQEIAEQFADKARAALATQQAEPEVERTPLSISRMACLIDGEARYAYQEIQGLVKTINYMVGIAERGRGVKCSAEESPEKFLLDYVKELEATQQAGQGEAVAWRNRKTGQIESAAAFSQPYNWGDKSDWDPLYFATPSRSREIGDK